ncbi:MAG: hypothetical protein ACD_62C00296G0001 [uncultured bacterium]|nr:MAG: hypothetical protein ACD_62C00296G0001 [uncultured bacterium]
MPIEYQKDGQRNHHAHRRRDKCVTPAISGSHVRGHKGSKKGTNVDPHVKNLKTGILLKAPLFIQITQHGRNVRLEKTAPKNNQQQRKEKYGQAVDEQQGVPRTHQNGTDDDRLGVTQPLVGQKTTQQGSEIGQSQENTVNLTGGCLL